jgi:hypothetical protein
MVSFRIRSKSTLAIIEFEGGPVSVRCGIRLRRRAFFRTNPIKSIEYNHFFHFSPRNGLNWPDSPLYNPYLIDSLEFIACPFMKLSVRGEYALRALAVLGAHFGGDVVRIQFISEQQNIPKRFLEQILNDLKAGGFVESRRGVAGGAQEEPDVEQRLRRAQLRPVPRRGAGGVDRSAGSGPAGRVMMGGCTFR